MEKLLYDLKIPKLLNDIRTFFGKPRKGYYKRVQREISMNDEGIFLDDTLVFKSVDIDICRICNLIDIEELERIERGLSLKFNLTPWVWFDPGSNDNQHYNISFIIASKYYQKSVCHLKIDASYVNPNPGMYMKKVFVDTL